RESGLRATTRKISRGCAASSLRVRTSRCRPTAPGFTANRSCFRSSALQESRLAPRIRVFASPPKSFDSNVRAMPEDESIERLRAALPKHLTLTDYLDRGAQGMVFRGKSSGKDAVLKVFAPDGDK